MSERDIAIATKNNIIVLVQKPNDKDGRRQLDVENAS